MTFKQASQSIYDGIFWNARVATNNGVNTDVNRAAELAVNRAVNDGVVDRDARERKSGSGD